MKIPSASGGGSVVWTDAEPTYTVCNKEEEYCKTQCKTQAVTGAGQIKEQDKASQAQYMKLPRKNGRK